MRNKKMMIVLFCLLLMAFLAGCTERVPPGYIGMIMKPGGLTKQVLAAGNHTCYGRDKMILIETKELTTSESLSVLCSDDLNFKFDLKIRSRLKAKDAKGIGRVLEAQGANIGWDRGRGVLRYDTLYETYVSPVARSIARGIVSKYETVQINTNREAIEKAVWEKLVKAIKGTPVEVVMAVTSNFDYPKVITEAVEKKRKREIGIQEEKAKQAMELLKADNRLKIAQKMKIVRVAEAEAEAAYMKIMGQALTEEFLTLKEIEARRLLYEKTGVGDKVIITGTGQITPMLPLK